MKGAGDKMGFHIGQKVVFVERVCIARKLGSLKWPPEVTTDRVLTIRDIDTRYLQWYGVVGLRFSELSYPSQHIARYGLVEPAFPADRFRPVVERKTDISVFTQILDDVRAGKVREIA